MYILRYTKYSETDISMNENMINMDTWLFPSSANLKYNKKF